MQEHSLKGSEPPGGPHSPQWSAKKSLWLWSMLLPSLLLGPWALSLDRAFVFGLFGLMTLCLGHSVGLHRAEIHGAFKTSPWCRALLLWCAALTGVGGPLSMIKLHHQRDYWQNQPHAPAYFGYAHSLPRDFLWNLHYEVKEMPPTPPEWPRQRRDRVLLFLERTWRLQTIALGAALWLFLGWEWVVVGVCMRVSAGILGHWVVNFITHHYGEHRYHIEGASEEGRNHRVLGWLTFGEGFHNNHHAYPSSARIGHERWDLDLGWLAVRAFERLGLVWDVKAYGRPEDGRNPRARRVQSEHAESKQCVV